jgi:hypothetical protein
MAQLSDEDLDINTQCAALESFNNHRKETSTWLNSENNNPDQERNTHKLKKKKSKASKSRKVQTPMSDLTGQHVSKIIDQRSVRLEKVA